LGLLEQLVTAAVDLFQTTVTTIEVNYSFEVPTIQLLYSNLRHLLIIEVAFFLDLIEGFGKTKAISSLPFNSDGAY